MNSNFPTVALSEVADFTRGLTYTKSDEVDFSSNIVLRANNVDLNSGTLLYEDLKYIRDSFLVPNEKKVKSGSLIICTASGSKSHLGKVALIPENVDMAFGGFMGMLSPRDGLDGRFLYYALRSQAYLDFISKVTDGANINNLKFSDLGLFEFPFPPLKEQKRIVAKLDEATANIDAFERSLRYRKEASRLAESRLRSLLIGSKSSGGIRTTLDQVTSIQSHLVDPTLPEHRYLPHIGAGNIEQGSSRLVDVISADEEGLRSAKFLFSREDVLYSKIRPYLRKVWSPDFDGLCSADMYPLRPKSEVLDREYLYWLLLSDHFTDYAIEGSARAGMPKVNRKHLFQYELTLPTLEEQGQTVRRIAQARTLSSEYVENLDLSRHQCANFREVLTSSILRGAA